MTNFNYSQIEEAYSRIKNYILKTPLVTNKHINKLKNANIFFKLENLQWTGSFKLRGATNKIIQLDDKDKKKGVVAYSSGNHAQAVAYASKNNNIHSTIVMPNNAPSIKIENTKKYGAEIILYDPKKESREEIGSKISKNLGKTLIKPYDDLDIISGQGTSGIEIADDLNKLNIEPDIFLCCCGGGGLTAGSSTYLKSKFPKIKCYSVEPESFDDTKKSLKQNRIIANKEDSISICDALLAPQPGNITFSINRNLLSGGLKVSDLEVKKAIIELAENLKIISEPGGAVAAAALFNDKIDVKNKSVVVMVSGGNIDNELFSKIVKDF